MLDEKIHQVGLLLYDPSMTICCFVSSQSSIDSTTLSAQPKSIPSTRKAKEWQRVAPIDVQNVPMVPCLGYVSMYDEELLIHAEGLELQQQSLLSRRTNSLRAG
jgi:hypothetical protein